VSDSFDLFQYGQLVANVDALERKIDKLETSVCQLVELANKSKGGFWMGMVIVSAISSCVGYLTHFLTIR
jgi:cell division protein FtsB